MLICVFNLQGTLFPQEALDFRLLFIEIRLGLFRPVRTSTSTLSFER